MVKITFLALSQFFKVVTYRKIIKKNYLSDLYFQIICSGPVFGRHLVTRGLAFEVEHFFFLYECISDA